MLCSFDYQWQQRCNDKFWFQQGRRNGGGKPFHSWLAIISRGVMQTVITFNWGATRKDFFFCQPMYGLKVQVWSNWNLLESKKMECYKMLWVNAFAEANGEMITCVCTWAWVKVSNQLHILLNLRNERLGLRTGLTILFMCLGFKIFSALEQVLERCELQEQVGPLCIG